MKFWGFLCFLCLYSVSVFSSETTADSLTMLFVQAKTQQEQGERCLNLDNYYRNILRKDSVSITETLLELGIKAQDEYIISDALRKLVMEINRKRRVLTNDSVLHYLAIAEENLTGERKRSFITEVNLRHIRSIADWTKDENSIIEELTSRYTNPDKNPEDLYFQIERNYALGMAAALSISESSVETYKNASRYFDRLFELIQKLPIEYGGEILFWVNENIYISYSNAGDNEKAVAFLEKMMDILHQYTELPNVKKDVYQTFEYVHSLYYEGVARFPSIVGRKKAFDCMIKADRMLEQRGDLISLYFMNKAFYEDIKEDSMIILYGDSIIGFMKTYDSPVAEAVISGIYKDQGRSYAALGNYKKAYKLTSKHVDLQEKITNGESKKLRADMEARYDLNHLELEKERLTSRNRQVALFFILFVFILSITWGSSQHFHLNKLKRIQKELIESNNEVVRQSEKAQESEKMKTAFLNSMCHELRTPLNSINGFSSLLLDPSIDAENKEMFPQLIQENTTLLTRLLSDLLEVANLNSSAEELPTEQANLRTICTQEMEKLQTTVGKSSIQYRIDISDNCCNICTNVPYLSQTIAHLLNNANKFTKSGEITLGSHRNANDQIEIHVTDTGIGIPKEKQEWVFERFTKIDDFEQGAGLGLYICRLIVNRLGGTICIDGNYTEGAHLVITLLK